MKYSFFVLMVVIAIIFSSCMNVKEEIAIQPNGSGSYSINLQMPGAMLDMLETLAAMDTTENSYNLLSRNIDTLFSLATYADTASNLSAEQKTLLKKASFHFQSTHEESEKKMQGELFLPFQSIEELQKISFLPSSENTGLSSLLGMQQEQTEVANSNSSSTDFSAIYRFAYKKGYLERSVDSVKWLHMKQTDEYAQLKQGIDFMNQFTYSIILHLPSEAKKISGPNATLSSDKKTVTIATDMGTVMKNPEALTYQIVY